MKFFQVSKHFLEFSWGIRGTIHIVVVFKEEFRW
jgi:hypothetical protein